MGLFFRRSIIKTFVRDHINRQSSGVSHTEELVRKKIQELRETWSDISKYPCLCEDGVSHDLSCCLMHKKDNPDPNDPTGCQVKNIIKFFS